jgi:hypothetical protein
MSENNPSQSPDDQSDLQSVLAKEAATEARPVNVDKLQQQAAEPTIAARKDSAYVDQQVQPGQVIGYGIPTNQNVEIPIAKGQKGISKKFKRQMLYLLILLVVLAIVAGIGAVAFKIISS